MAPGGAIKTGASRRGLGTPIHTSRDFPTEQEVEAALRSLTLAGHLHTRNESGQFSSWLLTDWYVRRYLRMDGIK